MYRTATSFALAASMLLGASTWATAGDSDPAVPAVQYRTVDTEVRIQVQPPLRTDRYERYDRTYDRRTDDSGFMQWYSDAVRYWQEYGYSRGYGQLEKFKLEYDKGEIEAEIKYEDGKIEIDDGKIKFKDD